MRKVLFVLVITLVVFAGLIYGLFFTKLFDIREISVTGAATISSEEIVSNVNEQLTHKFLSINRSSNMLFLKSNGVIKELSEDYPKLESITVKKEYFHKLNIEVKERSSVGIWCLMKKEQCLYFDKEGIIYDDAPNTSGFLVFNIKDERSRETNLGDRVESQIWLEDLALARQKLTELGFQIKELVIPEDSFDEFYAVVAAPPSGGWRVHLSIDTDIVSQVNNMASFLKQKLSSERISQLQYVDLRIADRIYYK